MCIIAYKPEDKILDQATIESCFMSNPDGAGFLVWDHVNNKLICEKGFFTVGSLIEAFKPYQSYRSIVHFRIGTCGGRNKDNCHPFLINNNLGFVHNGMISIKRTAQQYSDTWHFNIYLQSVLEKNPEMWEQDRFQAELKSIEKYLSWSKLAFLDNKGNAYIYGEEDGTWDMGCWFSNHGYMWHRRWNTHWTDDEVKTKEYNKYDNSTYDTVQCPTCMKDYEEKYENWNSEEKKFVCDDCHNFFKYFDEINKTAATAQKNDFLIDDDEFDDFGDYAGIVDWCEVCGEKAQLIYSNEQEDWICAECIKLMEGILEEEKQEEQLKLIGEPQ